MSDDGQMLTKSLRTRSVNLTNHSDFSSFVTIIYLLFLFLKGGVCRQTSSEFECDCTGTGYSGATCYSCNATLSSLKTKESQNQSINV